jgi:hypothetical protein
MKKRTKNKVKSKPSITLYSVYRKQTAIGFNMPTVNLVSDGDICTYLKSIKL